MHIARFSNKVYFGSVDSLLSLFFSRTFAPPALLPFLLEFQWSSDPTTTMKLALPLLTAILPFVHASLRDEVVIPPPVAMATGAPDPYCVDAKITEAQKKETKENLANRGMCTLYEYKEKKEEKVDLSTCYKACREDLGNPAGGCTMMNPVGYKDSSEDSSLCAWAGSCVCKKDAMGYQILLEWFISEIEKGIEEIAGPLFCGFIPMVGK